MTHEDVQDSIDMLIRLASDGARESLESVSKAWREQAVSPNGPMPVWLGVAALTMGAVLGLVKKAVSDAKDQRERLIKETHSVAFETEMLKEAVANVAKAINSYGQEQFRTVR